MTKPSLLCLLVLLVLLVLISSVASFERRGPDAPVKKDGCPAGRWSSTGFSGHAHEAQECEIKEVKNVKKTPSTPTEASEHIIAHPARTFRGRHPYASGVFTSGVFALEPALGVN